MADPKENVDMSSEAYTGFDWGKLDVIAQFPCERNVAAARMGCSTAWLSQCVKRRYGVTWKDYNKMRTREYLMPMVQKSIEKNLKKGNTDITKFVMKNNTDYKENPDIRQVDNNAEKQEIVFLEEEQERNNPLEGPSEVHKEPSEGSTP